MTPTNFSHLMLPSAAIRWIEEVLQAQFDQGKLDPEYPRLQELQSRLSYIMHEVERRNL